MNEAWQKELEKVIQFAFTYEYKPPKPNLKKTRINENQF